jgi:cell division protein FtsZ
VSNVFDLMDTTVSQNAVIKVIGVGGGGGNAVEHMVASGVEGVEFICANTDAQALNRSSAKTLLQLGTNITQGLGAGADPAVGKQAAVEDKERIIEILKGSDMIFITAGMGGGTGTGGAPVVAEIAREMGILTVAVVTKPFSFEKQKRMKIADAGISELAKYVDSLITIPNNKLLSVYKGIALKDAFKATDDVLLGAVQGITELITQPGIINVDFADVRTVMSEMGMSMMGSGSATGEGRAAKAAASAIASPLLEDIDLHGARGILVNVCASDDLRIDEFQEVGDVIQEIATDDATVVIGMACDPEMQEELRVTVVATGLEMPKEVQQAVQGVVVEEKPPVVGNNVRVMVNSAENHSSPAAPVLRTPPEATRKQPDAVRNSVPPSRDSAYNRNSSVKVPEVTMSKQNMDYLDIPAFLRRQAD